MKLFDWLAEHNGANIAHLLPQLLPFHEMNRVNKTLLNWKNLSVERKVERARRIVQMYGESAADDDSGKQTLFGPFLFLLTNCFL